MIVFRSESREEECLTDRHEIAAIALRRVGPTEMFRVNNSMTPIFAVSAPVQFSKAMRFLRYFLLIFCQRVTTIRTDCRELRPRGDHAHLSITALRTRSPSVAGIDRPFLDLQMTPKGHSRSNVMTHFY